MYFREPNKRVFNVKIGEKVVIKELDTVQKVGPFAANDEYIEVELRDEQIYVNGELCKGGYRANKQQFTVELEKLDRDLPNIVGLLLYDGGLEG